MWRGILLFWVMLGSGLPARAQGTKPDIAASYVQDLSNRTTIRIYLSNKYNSFSLRGNAVSEPVRFKPNSQINIGIGASYRKLTLNIGVKAPFLNKDDDRKGETKYFDAQANIHGYKQSTNLFLQTYRGYHISNRSPFDVGWEQSTAFPYREDMRQVNIGLSTLRILNAEKFSYRAAFNQDAVQLRSQGTWLVGGYATCYIVRADSSIIPAALQNQMNASSQITRGTFYDIGPMGGGAYTKVFKGHFFVTASGAIGIGPSAQFLQIQEEDAVSKQRSLGVGWHGQVRAGLGYNSRTRFVGILLNQEHIGYFMSIQRTFSWDVGNVRLVFAQRFKERPKRIDKGLRWLKKKTDPINPLSEP